MFTCRSLNVETHSSIDPIRNNNKTNDNSMEPPGLLPLLRICVKNAKLIKIFYNTHQFEFFSGESGREGVSDMFPVVVLKHGHSGRK